MNATERLIECVPNFSEGRNPAGIQKIVNAIAAVKGVKVLHTDTGLAANRTVITFAGKPEAVVEGAFRGIEAAASSIDMRTQHGAHPRIGATDVCPLVPISNISMKEVVEFSKVLGRRVGEELGIPVYLYENAASSTERKNLEHIRSGEYEGLAEKMKSEKWKPDFGPAVFNAKSGATVIGARNFLIAYNINLNTKSVPIAKAIAGIIRESGNLKHSGTLNTGELITGSDGKPLRVPGLLKGVKAIGWYIEEYQKAQVSVNITNYKLTAFHTVFEEVGRVAASFGVELSGSELIGLIPLEAILLAGNYFADKIAGLSPLKENELLELAIQKMGLDAVAPFDPRKKIIDYLL
jgi:glutamate formiminotransferase/formiminotetrahydrofolate cyclodeaminase